MATNKRHLKLSLPQWFRKSVGCGLLDEWKEAVHAGQSAKLPVQTITLCKEGAK